MNIDSGHILSCNYTVQFAGGSDTGRRRSRNEDSFAMITEKFLFCVADGVGGMQAGEVASQKAISSLEQPTSHKVRQKPSLLRKIVSLIPGQGHLRYSSLKEKIFYANKKVYQLSQSSQKQMATTIVAIELKGDIAEICNVGDSRAYLLRKNIFGQITIDHTLSMSLLMAGGYPEKTNTSYNRHTITRALGSHPNVEVDQHIFHIQQGDIFLLCSDGLTDMLNDQIIFKTIIKKGNPLKSILTLIQKANAAGGQDNISVIIVAIDSLEKC